MPNNYKFIDVSQLDYPLKDGYFFANFDAGAKFKETMERLAPGLLSMRDISIRKGDNRSEALIECSFKVPSLSNHRFYIYVCPVEGGGRKLEHEQRIQFRPNNQWSPDLSSLKVATNFDRNAQISLENRECYCIGIYIPYSQTDTEDIVFTGLYPSTISPFEGVNTSNGSIQVDINYIRKAYLDGISVYVKSDNKRIICFKPQYLFWYMINRDELHVGDLNRANAIVEEIVKANSYTPLEVAMGEMPLQHIYYGAPGTGKSHKIEQFFRINCIPDKKIFRVTFHPDTDYASFVGCYKPTSLYSGDIASKDEDTLRIELRNLLSQESVSNSSVATFVNANKASLMALYDENWVNNFIESVEGCVPYADVIKCMLKAASYGVVEKPQQGKIVYSFVAQAFLKAYVEAWKYPAENVYLVVEEINRGNCAQIFGDTFQLLDRAQSGYSKYKVRVDSDIESFLKRPDQLGDHNDGIKDGSITLPPNFYIWATMNTSDQSLYQMDSAFKRRWSQEYVPIEYADANAAVLDLGEGVVYKWGDVLHVLNKYIKKNTESANKTIGNRFIDFDLLEKRIDYKTFRDKVLFYLFNDVFKDNVDFAKEFFGESYDDDHQFFEDLCVDDSPSILKAFFKKWENEGTLQNISDETASDNNDDSSIQEEQ